MNNLCLLANEFPYGTWEPYLETEAQYYNEFDKIFICSLQLRDKDRINIREIPNNPTVIPVRYVSRLQYFIESIIK